MSRKMGNNMILLGILALICSAAIVMQVLYPHFTQMRIYDYCSQSKLIAQMLTEENRDLLQKAEPLSLHILLIYGEGDSEVISDHRLGADMLGGDPWLWPEVVEARQRGEGDNTQHGKSLSGQIVSYARQLEDGSVLHISGQQDTRLALAMYCLWGLLILAVLLAGAAIWRSARVTRAIVAPLNKERLEQIETRQLCPELQPLATRILDENQQMQKQIQKQHNELKREYEKQDRARRDFTANVSHELKTPLTSISGYAEIVRSGMVKPEDVVPFAGKIYDEAQRMITLVGDILKLSQLDEGHQVRMERTSMDLYGICQQVLDSLQAVALQRRVTFSLSGEHCRTVGAASIIDEIIYNLCDNAIKYNIDGGEVFVSVTKQEDMAVVSVRDTGIGISPEEQARVFERFYRVDKSHSKEIGGTGLGLSIVKHGAAYHDARVELESQLGEGTEIRVFFQRESD